MENSRFTEKLGSLWSFSNVLSSRSQTMVSDTNEKATQFFVNHSSKVEPTKPLSLIVENKKNQIENTKVLDQLQSVVIVVSLLLKPKPR